MSFEMDEIELEETEQLLEESDYYDESFNELEGFNPEIFDDPELMVKWLEKQPNNVKKKQRENIKDDEFSKNFFPKGTEYEELLVDRKEQISVESVEEKSHRDSSNNEPIPSPDEKNENLNQNEIHLILEKNHCKRLNVLENIFLKSESDILYQIKKIDEKIQEKTKKINKLSFVQLFEKRALRKEIEQLQQEKFQKQKKLDLLKKEYENEVEEEKNNYLRESEKK